MGNVKPVAELQTVEELFEALRRDALVQRWASKHKPLLVESPEDVIGEQRSWSLGALSPGMMDPMPRERAIQLGVAIIDAAPYLWTAAMKQAALESRLPRHVIGREILPSPLMWWTFRSGIGTEEDYFDAMLLQGIPEGFGVMLLAAPNGKIQIRQTPLIRYGSRFPDDYAEEYRDGIEAALAMLSFLASPFIGLTRHMTTRAWRRRETALRSDGVTFIELRHSLDIADSVSHGEGSVDWQRRWLVRGHHRAQWYPTQQSHKVLWIAPYIKGPADKPFVIQPARVSR